MANAVLETCVETREDEEISPHKSFEEENEYYRLESVPIAFEEPEKTSRGGKGLRKRAKRATTGAAVRAGAAKGAKMSKRKPTLDEESEEETTPDEESEEENKSTDGESKKTRPGGKPGNSNSRGGKGEDNSIADWKTVAKRVAIGAAIGAVIGAGVALIGTQTVAVKVGLTAVKILLSSL